RGRQASCYTTIAQCVQPAVVSSHPDCTVGILVECSYVVTRKSVALSQSDETSAIVTESRETTVSRDPQRTTRTLQDVLNVIAGQSIARCEVSGLRAVESNETTIGSDPKPAVAILLNHLDRTTRDSKLIRHISVPVVLQPADSLQRPDPQSAQAIFV